MNSFLLGIGTSLGIWIAWKVIFIFWKNDKEKIEAAGKSIDDKLQEKTGIVFPSWVHEKWDAIIHEVIIYLDGYLSDPKQIRNFLRFVISLSDVSKAKMVFDELSTKAIECWFTDASPTLKEIVNEFRQIEGEKIVSAKAKISLPGDFVAKQNITESVRAGVVSSNTLKTDTVLSPNVNDALRRSPEIQEEIEKLRKKVEKC